MNNIVNNCAVGIQFEELHATTLVLSGVLTKLLKETLSTH